MLRDLSNSSVVWERFFEERCKDLRERFPGYYRAIVVETNDPLQIYRIRFKCPELHDNTLKPEECPWAVPAPWLSGKDCGSWHHPIIGDTVFITFEKQHPYGPIWVGFAMGTRRKRYPLESIYTKSPIPVDKEENKRSAPDEEWTPIQDYLAKDFRPMQTGWRDRYGNSEIHNAIGFFPIEHKPKPAPQDVDALTQSKFTPEGKDPKINEPDRKYLARLSKYGIFALHSDIGYYWNKETDPYGEFKGIGDDLDDGGAEERQFEIDRFQYFVKLFNEDKPNSADRDQRRYEIRTRAGHKFEMRDVGWSQKDGGLAGCQKIQDAKCRTENGTYGKERVLSKWEKSDERWLKLRTKGGHLFQMMDMGFHPEKDTFYKKKLIEECGPDVDHEKDAKWISRDSRQMRWLTRWGVKLVLDDRGSDPKDADTKQNPRGVGWMLKTRRSWEPEGTPRGFAIEAVDKDDLNTTRWYTPKSKIIEMNDRKDYCLFCTDMSGEVSREWKGLDENEFALSIGMTFSPEQDTYHLKLDKRNGYIRLKTAAGGDNGRRPIPEPESHVAGFGMQDQKADGEPMKDADTGLNQGIEMRDAGLRATQDGPWTEIVDLEHRGMWWTKNYKMGIWRSKQDKDQFILIHDGNNTIVLRNNEDGPLQIYCQKDIEIISGQDINLKADRDISLKAGRNIIMDAEGQMTSRAKILHAWQSADSHAALLPGSWLMDVPDNAPMHTGFLPEAAPCPPRYGCGAQSDTGGSTETLPGNEPTPIEQDPIEPTDRALTKNMPFDAVDEKVIKQCDGA
jgi:hypothetical protein